MTDATVRQARPDDHEDVVAFTDETWTDRDERDYLPDVFREWVAGDGPDQRTVVVEVEDGVVGCCQARLLTDHEAWLQGMRVDPAYRQAGYGLRMVGGLFEWASDRGATVARNLVFSWNDAGLGQSVAAGFAPRTSFRWARPTPRPAEPDALVESDPDAAWSFWARSDARDALAGLALDRTHAWALSELSRERLRDLADRERVFAVKGNGTRAMGVRVRTTERAVEQGSEEDDPDADGGTETLAEYGVAAWADEAAAEALFDAIRRDAAEVGADAARVLLPETPRHVAEAAYVRADTGEYPSFVLEADLTGAE